MHVNVNFTLNVDPYEWLGRERWGVKPDGSPMDVNDPDVVQLIVTEVRAHAENVVRDLFADQGWALPETADA